MTLMLSRRGLLGGSAAALAAITMPIPKAALAQASSGSVNLQTLGADPNGIIPCDTILENAFMIARRVWVPPGYYLRDRQIASCPALSQIIGSGAATKFFCNPGPQISDVMFTYTGVAGVQIRDMMIDCNSRFSSGIGLDHVLNARVLDVEVKNTCGAGLVAGYTSDFTFSRMTFNSIGRGAYTGGQHAISVFASDDGRIEANRINGPIANAGINLGNVNNVTVIGNTIRGGVDEFGGIRFSNQSTKITATGNTIEGWWRGLSLNGCKDITCVANVLAEQGLDAIVLRSGVGPTGVHDTCDGHAIEANKIVNPGNASGGLVAGIFIWGADGDFNGNHTIIGNSHSNRNGRSNVIVRDYSGFGSTTKIGWNNGNVPET